MSGLEKPQFTLLNRDHPNRDRIADLERQLAEAQGKLDAVKEQVAYGFTGETLANMKDGMSGKEMNEWWRKTLDRILHPKEAK